MPLCPLNALHLSWAMQQHVSASEVWGCAPFKVLPSFDSSHACSSTREVLWSACRAEGERMCSAGGCNEPV